LAVVRRCTRVRMLWAMMVVTVPAATLIGGGCYRPQELVGPKPPSTLVGVIAGSWPQTPGMRLHVFNTGANRVSPLLAGSPALWRPAPAFVIEHPRRGLVVFDAGLGPEIGEEAEGALHPITGFLFKTRSRPGRDLAAQMETAGFAPDAVDTVILSHLHFDHVGSAKAFANATFVSGLGERARSSSRMNGFEPTKLDWIQQASWREIDFSDASPYATFDRSFDLFGDASIILVAGGGHTEGGMAALLNLPQGPVLLAGDLVVHFDWLASDDVQRIVVDAERAADVRNRIRRLRELAPGVVVVPGHDLQGLPQGRSDLILHDADQFSPQAWPIAAR
jgi:N-acyl homoserine lactone hydrolase